MQQEGRRPAQHTTDQTTQHLQAFISTRSDAQVMHSTGHAQHRSCTAQVMHSTADTPPAAVPCWAAQHVCRCARQKHARPYYTLVERGRCASCQASRDTSALCLRHSVGVSTSPEQGLGRNCNSRRQHAVQPLCAAHSRPSNGPPVASAASPLDLLLC
jgi:hypothetical protein